MASVSPQSSVSQMTEEERVGLEMPQAPSLLFGDLSLLRDVGLKAKVVEAYYLALAKYYDALALSYGARSSLIGVNVDASVVATSAVGSSVASSRRRNRRRLRAAAALVGSQCEQVDEDGLTYLRLVVQQCRSFVREQLGRYPSLAAVARLDDKMIVDGNKLDAVRCEVGIGSVEFSDGGSYSLSEVFSSVASHEVFVEGQFGYRYVDGSVLAPVDGRFVVGAGLSAATLALAELPEEACGASFLLNTSPGYCYLRLIRPEFRLSYRSLLGSMPSIGILLRMPLALFDLSAMDLLVRRYESAIHVGADHGDVFGSFAASVLKLEDYGLCEGTLASWISANYCATVVVGKRQWLVGAMSHMAQELLSRLCGATGLGSEAFDAELLELAVRTTAMLEASDKRKHRTLEALGDSVLSVALAEKCFDESRDVQAYQSARSILSSNAYLASLLIRSTLADCVQFVSGVPRAGKAGADAFEVIIGVIYKAGSVSAVLKFCQHLRMFDDIDTLCGA